MMKRTQKKYSKSKVDMKKAWKDFDEMEMELECIYENKKLYTKSKSR